MNKEMSPTPSTLDKFYDRILVLARVDENQKQNPDYISEWRILAEFVKGEANRMRMNGIEERRLNSFRSQRSKRCKSS